MISPKRACHHTSCAKAIVNSQPMNQMIPIPVSTRIGLELESDPMEFSFPLLGVNDLDNLILPEDFPHDLYSMVMGI